MLHLRRFPRRLVVLFALPRILASSAWAVAIYVAYATWDLSFLRVPFLPISTIGTAVAFYVGFKNNSAYDRFWEGRKIWGGIVNASRTWAVNVRAFVSPEAGAHRELIYRQLAWINALRIQLRKTSRLREDGNWFVRRRLRRHDADGVLRQDFDTEVGAFLDDAEAAEVKAMVNPATHLVDRQAQRLRALLADGHVDLFHQIALLAGLKELFDLQGKCERIKNTPLPRQYAEASRMFTTVFVFLVPLGLLDVFALAGVGTSPLSVAAMALSSGVIAWVFVTMEQVGDASEDPFESSMADVPMNALCRTIERDLRQLLGETELPEGEKPAGAILY